MANNAIVNIAGATPGSTNTSFFDCKDHFASIVNRLVVVSYNLHGLNQGKVVLTELTSSMSISLDAIMIRELWLTPDNLYKVTKLTNLTNISYSVRQLCWYLCALAL